MRIAVLVAIVLASPHLPAAPTVAIVTPVRDNTIYAPSGESNSNGGGGLMSAGNNGLAQPRRGLVAFDLSVISPAAFIYDATLTLRLGRAAFGDGDRLVSLHRLLASWGENQASDAGIEGQSGFGVMAQPGDATWIARFFLQGMNWTSPGGDFVAAASATTNITQDLIPYVWSGPGLVADVRLWVASPAVNFGWLLRGDESIERTNRMFHTREHPTPGTAPMLAISYSPPALERIDPEPGGGWRATFIGAAGRTFQIEWSENLAAGSWQPLVQRTADAQGHFDCVDVPPGGVTRRFYRSRLLP